MSPLSPKRFLYSYTSLPTRSHDELSSTGAQKLSQSKKPSHIPQYLKLICFSVASILFGFFLGNWFAQRQLSTEGLVLSTKPYKFAMEPLFGDKPSNESDAAWEELFPARGGFFNHPTIAPKRAAYAVFHQLHCLNGLRQAYWTTLEMATSTTALDVNTIPFEISPPHMRHCIDLLRQTLMCKPDLTVEIKNETLQGVTGFGTVHQCRDWGQLMDWMTEWEDVGAPVQTPGEGAHGHSHHHGS